MNYESQENIESREVEVVTGSSISEHHFPEKILPTAGLEEAHNIGAIATHTQRLLQRDSNEIVENSKSNLSDGSTNDSSQCSFFEENCIRIREIFNKLRHSESCANEEILLATQNIRGILMDRETLKNELEELRMRYTDVERVLSSKQAEITSLKEELAAVKIACKELQEIDELNFAETDVAAAEASHSSRKRTRQKLSAHPIEFFTRRGLNPTELLRFWFNGHDEISNLTKERDQFRESCTMLESQLAVEKKKCSEYTETRAAILKLATLLEWQD